MRGAWGGDGSVGLLSLGSGRLSNSKTTAFGRDRLAAPRSEMPPRTMSIFAIVIRRSNEAQHTPSTVPVRGSCSAPTAGSIAGSDMDRQTDRTANDFIAQYSTAA